MVSKSDFFLINTLGQEFHLLTSAPEFSEVRKRMCVFGVITRTRGQWLGEHDSCLGPGWINTLRCLGKSGLPNIPMPEKFSQCSEPSEPSGLENHKNKGATLQWAYKIGPPSLCLSLYWVLLVCLLFCC